MKAIGRICVLSVLLGLALPATAETYRWLDPATGRIVLSNQPPPPGVKTLPTRRASSGDSDGDLPPALRDPVRRFPVTLFTMAPCKEPCDNARLLLQVRGIPYVEKSADTPELFAELKTLSGETAIPTLMVGRQASRGYELGAWNSLLDLAGYPQRPPAGYQPPKPAPAAETASAPETAAGK